jgi:predicted ATPase with chaperone activity
MAMIEPIAAESLGASLPRPKTIEETGLSFDLVLQTVTKTLHFAGELTGTELADRLGVGFGVVQPCLDMLKRDQHCEITGGGVVGAPAFRYRLTDAGRIRAAIFVRQNQFVGKLPVPLDQYTAYMRAFARQNVTHVSREAVRQAFSHLVVADRVLDQLGPAISAGHSLFVYGPPGNGKTVVSQAIRNLLKGEIAIPHALSIDGHVVQLLDPITHEVSSDSPVHSEGVLDRQQPMDGRWEICRRPLVTVGGELTMKSLELAATGFGYYRAPVQAVANGGVLVIDDFGRQHASPRDLLNRWIVPLENRVDYCTLDTGQKFQLPFEVLLVFATNLKPADLVDEAFLRRIQYKVFAQSPTPGEFIQIFEMYCHQKQVPFERRLATALIEEQLRPRNVQLRGCQPRDLIEHALSLADYLGRPRALTMDLLSAACDTYFVDDNEPDAQLNGRA